MLTKKLFEMVKVTKSSPASQRDGVKKENMIYINDILIITIISLTAMRFFRGE